MSWFAQSTILVALIAVAVFVVAHLLDRIRRLEQRFEQRFDSQSADLLRLVNHMGTAVLQPGPDEAERPKAESLYEASKLMDEIGYHLRRHIPALREVLSVRIGVSLEFLREKTGITDEELKGLEGQLSPEALWPASSMVIEEWSTHTVITDFSGRRDVIYPDWNFLDLEPRVIWEHVLPGTRGFHNGGKLEVVLHEGGVKFWARGGRFKGRHWCGESEDEYLLASVPLSEDGLRNYRILAEPSDDPEMASWIRHYGSGVLAEGVKWTVTVNDVVAFTTER
ncbi:MAG: hypothetical protein AAB225_26560 [Acidobacteriota bacterium]